MRDLKELHWRSRGPRLPQTVLDAATLRIGAPLPETYRQFLSHVDGGRIGRGGFRASEREWLIGGFFPFADAAGLAEKLRKSGRLPQGYMPVAYAESPEKPLVYMELTGAGRVFLKPSAKTRWEDAGSVLHLGESFAEFLDLLGDAPKEGAVVNPPELTARAPAAPAARPAPAVKPSSKPITSPAAAAARAVGAAAKVRPPLTASVKASAGRAPLTASTKAAAATTRLEPAANAKVKGPVKAKAATKPAKAATKPAKPAKPAKATKPTKPAKAAAKPAKAKAAAKPAKATPAAKPAKAKAAAKPAKATPAAKPAKATPAAKPAKAKPTGKPAKATPAAKPARPKGKPVAKAAKAKPAAAKAKPAKGGKPRR